MSLRKNNNNAFTANLYLNGLPLVLNQQRLKQLLREPRITKREQLDAEVALANSHEASFITLAGHEDDKPLLLKFTPQGDSYSINIALRGVFDGARWVIESDTYNLRVSHSERSEVFSISKVVGEKTSLDDLEAGPAYIHLVADSNKKSLYSSTAGQVSFFKSVDPNVTGHVAYNNKPAVFVIKVIDKLPVGA
ncbi:hypothetical protein PSH79_24175 [Pseudomonas sp. FP2196]|uniref:hypothetical protein n=1 Tax=Pseudomonas sp. FP2196 TaxID=2954086 RepID=UPI002734540C|nr:hypothetical protein [Pseudomonas sp. FP2196]WLH34980.1 hypothetical protein PSH79_24175 [Pseudomonas sp. FP2196]